MLDITLLTSHATGTVKFDVFPLKKPIACLWSNHNLFSDEHMLNTDSVVEMHQRAKNYQKYLVAYSPDILILD